MERRGEIVLTRGEHFICSLPAIIQQVRTAASLREININVMPAEDGNAVVVRYVLWANGHRALASRRK